MPIQEFGDVRAVAKQLGVSVSTLNKLRLYAPERSPPWLLISRRVVYPITGPNSLETWCADRVQNGGPK